MASLVLARKYRPRRFADMVGQPHVVQALTNALASGRLHHAWLFTGTRGVGKTTVSRILAKALNCTGPDGEGGVTAEPCGQCASCRDIDADRFVDYVEMDAASNRGIDDVRDLLERANYKPAVGRFKVYMIDEVHQLTKESFNALLKTLEEPPDYLKFVLATTDPQKVPVTVLSRCLQFGLRPMAPPTIRDHLARVLQAEGVAAEPAALALLARAARGSMRDALSLTDQALAFGGGTVAASAVRAMLGVAGDHLAYEIIEALARGDGCAVVQACDALRREGGSAPSLLEDMAALLQRMAVVQLAPGAAATPAGSMAAADEPQPVGDGRAWDEDGDGAGDDPEPTDRLERLAQLMPPDETQLLYSLCLQGRAELGLAPDEYAGLTMVLLRLLAFKPTGNAEKKSLNPAGEPQPGRAPSTAGPPTGESGVAPASEQAEAAVAMATDTGEGPWAPAGGLAQAPAAWSEPETVAGLQREPIAEAARASGAGAVRRLPVRDPARQRRAGGDSGAQVDAAAADDAPVLAVPLRAWPLADDGAAAGAATNAQCLRETAEGKFWADCVNALTEAGAITALTRELALQSQLLARDDTHWQLRVEKTTLVAQRERLQAALHGAGYPVALAIEVGPVHNCPQMRNDAKRADQRRQALDLLTGGEVFRQLSQEYCATILPETLRIEPLGDEPIGEESQPCSTKDNSPA